MNEAKQKADELVNKFTPYAESSTSIMYHATLCALITVNEVLESMPTLPSLKMIDAECRREAKEFWQAVKEELESRL